MSALDASNLRVEEHGLPMQVAGLAFLEPGPLLDAEGRLRLEELRRQVEQRTRAAPRLRQRLAPPEHGRGRPAWVTVTDLDITRHVRALTVPAPGGEPELLAQCAEVTAAPLPRDRPLWEVVLLTGLADGRIALLVRLHHVVADGVAALRLLAALLDSPRESPAGSSAGSSAGPASPAHGTRGPATGLRALVGRVRGTASLARAGRAPRTSFNRPVGGRRRLVLLRGDLAAASAAGHARGGTVNDVLLAATAGGLRRLLAARGEHVAGRTLRVSVAASLRAPGASAPSGNLVGVRVVPVPVDEPDASARLARIAATTAAARSTPPFRPGGRLAQRWMVRVMARQRLVNLLLSNLPGPTVPLSFGGARVEELFQVGTVQGNLPLSVGVLSYAGRLGVTLVADADALPDLDVLAAGMAADLDELGVLRP